MNKVFYFGPFTLDAAQHRLYRRGLAVRITSRTLRLLHVLVSNPAVTLRFEDLVAMAWEDRENRSEVTEATLRQHVLMLRHALDESATNRYIATDYGRGYRFVGEVTERPSPLVDSLVEQFCAAGAEFRDAASPAALTASLNLYERALNIDDSSAPALAGAALTRVLVADFLYRRPKEQLEIAKGLAEAALAADPNSVEALCALCKVRLDYNWDFAAAEVLAQRALAIDPHHRIAAFMYAWILVLTGRSTESLAFVDALPGDVGGTNIMQTCCGIAALFSGKYANAMERLGAASKRWPDYWFARTFLGLSLLLAGGEREALHHFDAVRVAAYDPLVDRQMNARFFAEGYALYARFRIGENEEAAAALQRLTRLSEAQFVPSTCFALAELGRGDVQAALRHIEASRENRECWYTHLGVDPIVKDLHLDPGALYRAA
ncbi:MAG TPA: winged helix-turn-helix domain-containing protein [Candidatus Cybelea sp.]|jgi:DNA-binding winged helix-turn-helix (wHTH) protein|nr:winged helix-turn-helix domain-containing protein [Candidatus Cybelea sp.]